MNGHVDSIIENAKALLTKMPHTAHAFDSSQPLLTEIEKQSLGSSACTIQDLLNVIQCYQYFTKSINHKDKILFDQYGVNWFCSYIENKQ